MALLHVNFYSEALGMATDMDVILPEETKRQIGMKGSAGKSWPVLYLLHGMSDDHTIWERRTSIERYASGLGLAVVMPTTRLGWYCDMYRGYAYWTYIAKELPEICRRMFPRISKKREDTFAAGLSMGGYGALKCALRAPETFSFAASLSGGCDILRISKRTSLGSTEYWEDVFGPEETRKGSFNDLFAAADELAADADKPKPDFYLWCGTEDSLYPQSVDMRDKLVQDGFHVTYEECAGTHAWQLWDEKIQTVLKLLPIKGGK